MSISGISSNSYTFPQVTQTGSSLQANNVDAVGGRVSGAGASGGPGGFLNAVFEALSQAGVSGAPSTTAAAGADATTSKNPLQALGAFMHELFAALHAQGGHSAGQGDGDRDAGVASAASGSSAVSGISHGKGGGLATMESNLQNLIQQVSSSASSASPTDSTTTTGTSTTSTAAASSTNPTALLQQDYQNLLSSLGVTGNSSSLSGFLQSLSQNLQGIGSSGNVVNTQA